MNRWTDGQTQPFIKKLGASKRERKKADWKKAKLMRGSEALGEGLLMAHDSFGGPKGLGRRPVALGGGHRHIYLN